LIDSWKLKLYYPENKVPYFLKKTNKCILNYIFIPKHHIRILCNYYGNMVPIKGLNYLSIQKKKEILIFKNNITIYFSIIIDDGWQYIGT